VNGWEFAAELITKSYSWVFASIVLIVFRRQLRELAGRVKRGKVAGLEFEAADPAALGKAVAEAAEETSDLDERRRQVEEVAKTAAMTAQYIHYISTPVQGRFTFFEPRFTWQDDGSVRTQLIPLSGSPNLWVDREKNLHLGPTPLATGCPRGKKPRQA
jgi:hypothetical protein